MNELIIPDLLVEPKRPEVRLEMPVPRYDIKEIARMFDIPLAETSEHFDEKDAMGKQASLKAERMQILRMNAMSPPNSLGLPPLLEKRRWEHTIPDAAFETVQSFSFVTLYQISQFEGETYGDTKIVMADATRDREKNEAPRGVLISAGLQAMDILRSNGIDLGHVVTFIRVAPFRQRVGVIGARNEYVLGLQVGDIRGSEDLAKELRSGWSRIKLHTLEDGSVEHRIENADGAAWKPSRPWIAEDL